jgi:hypothetical protein
VTTAQTRVKDYLDAVRRSRRRVVAHYIAVKTLKPTKNQLQDYIKSRWMRSQQPQPKVLNYQTDGCRQANFAASWCLIRSQNNSSVLDVMRSVVSLQPEQLRNSTHSALNLSGLQHFKQTKFGGWRAQTDPLASSHPAYSSSEWIWPSKRSLAVSDDFF